MVSPGDLLVKGYSTEFHNTWSRSKEVRSELSLVHAYIAAQDPKLQQPFLILDSHRHPPHDDVLVPSSVDLSLSHSYGVLFTRAGALP